MTKIEWVKNQDGTQGKTWNPVTGCSPISEGCQNCYAKRMANRLRGQYGYPANEPFRVTLRPERLVDPLHWRKPSMIFVCSMGDLFHEDVPFDYIDRVFAVMALCPWHTFQILTKRPRRAVGYMNDYDGYTDKLGPIGEIMQDEFGWMTPEDAANIAPPGSELPKWPEWPLSNIWLGVTAENRPMWYERVPILKQIEAAKRFVSYEPALGPLGEVNLTNIDWVICGSESGPKRRPAKVEWIRDLKDQCVDAGVPFFLKQIEINKEIVKMPELDGQIWNEYPEANS